MIKKLLITLLTLGSLYSFAKEDTPCPLDIITRGNYRRAVLSKKNIIERKGYSIANIRRNFDYSRNIRLVAEAYTEQPGGKLGVQVTLEVTRNYERMLFSEIREGKQYLSSKYSTIRNIMSSIPTCAELRIKYPDLYL